MFSFTQLLFTCLLFLAMHITSRDTAAAVCIKKTKEIKQTAKKNITKKNLGQWDSQAKKKKRKVSYLIYLSLIYLFPLRLNSTIVLFMLPPNCTNLMREECGSWISGGLVVEARGGTMFSLHELPVNLLIKHANGCNCSWW